MTRSAWKVVVPAFAAGALVLGLAEGVASADSDTPNPHHVFGTGGDGLWMHSVPRLQDGLIAVVPDGTDFDVVCWSIGDAVSGNSVWMYGTAGGYTGYASDAFIDTAWTTTADLNAQGIPECGSNPAPAAPTSAAPAPVANVPAAEANIVLGNSAGEHEYAVQALEPDIEAAAARAGVDGQTLARIIYHEGGSYFSARRSFIELQEMTYAGSVGIGQIRVETARLVDLQVYQDWAMMQEPDDLVVRSRLIYDWGYALRTAAGYVRLLQDAGVEGSWPQFMAYSLDVNTAQRWKATGHSMEPAVLEGLGIDADAFRARQQYFNDAVAAVG